MCFILAMCFASCLFSQSLESKIDQLLTKDFNSNSTGVSVLVAKNENPLYQKAFGLANLELNVPMTPDHVFEIGSITKQFTAVAILMLQEKGKLNIEDAITKYIPDYPTQGKTITIHHLLNHTSGIKSYTSIKSFMKLSKTDLSPKELINVFKDEPMNFNPGEKYSYNNSGYILLGYIIEVVTGESYENFIEKNIFNKINMSSSYYGNKSKVIKNRASGYSKAGNEYINAEYISMTLPYAAGSLMSTTSDLLKWQNALNNNELISKASFEKASNGSTLNDKTHIPYGYGLQKGKINGSMSIQHGGSIFGFKSMGIYLPEEKVFVSVLSNCICKSPTILAKKIAALAIDKPYPNLDNSVKLDEKELKKWEGAYLFGDVVRHITIKDNFLFSQIEGRAKNKLFPLSANKFIFKNGFPAYEFSIKDDGSRQLKMITDDNSYIGLETEKTPPVEKKAITLSNHILKPYVGKYELTPSFIITITATGNKIFAQATGQPKFEIFAESETKFFLKVVVASIEFNKNEKGEVTGLILHQNGQGMPGKKIE